MKSSKGTLDYWYDRIRKNSFKRTDGSTYTSPEYEIYMSVGGKQQRFKLGTGNKEVAAEKALEIYMYNRANGAQATLEKYKQKKTVAVDDPTVGQFLEEIGRLRLIKQTTFTDYSRKFRTVVSGVFRIPADKSRCYHRGEAVKAWRNRVDSIKISDLSASRIMQWRANYLDGLEQDPIAQRRGKATVTSLLRNSKALFSPKYVKHLTFKLPQNPFDGLVIGGSTTRQYKSEVDFMSLANKAKEELYAELSDLPAIDDKQMRKSTIALNKALSKREQFKIILLCLGCGMRRSEADTLLWTNVDFKSNKIRVEATEYGDVKGASSERVIDVDATVVELLAKFKEEASGSFVIESNRKPKPSVRYHYYRCDHHFKRLIAWLHTQGITQRNAIHELRKEFGSQLTEQFGIYVASKALGHSEVTTTARSYLEKKGHKSLAIF
ncbi:MULTISPECIES: tyrosine-type recombinase/integrase [Cerasicoccaceae]|uniref:tyrosine-type recombinase/integrase n=1 Tax=Cerasicoccaceae TaxID=3056374 RepID=UPI001C736089|nr:MULTISPECIES: tyrosine-type recombinase/integrase [Cerasicoccaceae]QYY35452.1 tyrosine-type recombinase/integrase [Ruficoccus sp. ZRK36]